MELETILGNLRNAYKEVEPGTMLHVDALQAARIKDVSLRTVGFWAADGMIYHLVDGFPHLAMTRERENPVLRHIDDAFAQLGETGNYRPSREDVASALASEQTVDIDLTSLHLQGNDAECGYLPISPQEYSSLNTEERKLAERVHGSGDAFAATMKMLADGGIKETKVYVLNPVYVRKNATEAAIGRASWLNNFNNDSNFSAVVRLISYDSHLRGVRRRASVSEPVGPEGRVVKGVDYLAIYQTILANPEKAREALDDTTASGLREILDGYDSRRT